MKWTDGTWVKLAKALTACALTLPILANATPLASFKTVFDTDFQAAGIGGMRNGDGTASLSLTGVSGTVTEAWLYWHGPTNVTDTPEAAIQNVSFDGNDITGEYLGISDDNCWGFANSVAYRSDVSGFVTGDKSYDLANFVQPNANINGVSLIVFFDDGDGTNNKDIVLFDGNDSNIANAFDPNGWDITLAGIDYDTGNAAMQMHVADGQSFLDDEVIVNGTNVANAGPVFQGTEAQDAGSGFPGNGLLWDIKEFDVTSLLSPGDNTLQMTTEVSADCLACVLVAIELPAGAAPPTDVPEPSPLALLALGLLGIAIGRKRIQP